MIKNLTISLFIGAISAINLDQKMSLFGNDESCDANLKRIHANKPVTGEDSEFPASQYSLFWESHNQSDAMKTKYKTVTKWATPRQLVGQGQTPSLWGEKGVLPAGTKQGKLGDCWFLAAGSAIGEHPNRIQEIFKNKDYPGNGVFTVTFYHKGLPVDVSIDDRLALMPDGELMNSRMSVNKAWWQPILEKAYAKFNVNFSNLNGGNPGQALRELTGMPTDMFDSAKQSNEEFFKIVKEGDDKQWIMTAACMNEIDSLVPGHAYTILGVVELKKPDRSVAHSLVKMRNPWGKERYNGKFHDKDSAWTEDFKKQAKLVIADDGVFHIPVEDWKKAFTVYNIAQYGVYQTSHVQVKGKGKKFAKYFKNTEDQDVIATVDYQNSRQIPFGCSMPKMFYNLYIVEGGKVLGDPKPINKQIAHGMRRFKAEKGKQYILLVVNWGDTDVEGDFTLSTYAEKAKADLSV